MKKIWNVLFIIILFTVNSYASSRSDVKILEATENIRYLGQKISKEYLYLYYNPKEFELKVSLLEDIESIGLAIRDISMSTMSSDSKNILDFLAYNQNEIEALLKKAVSEENGRLMLDYSESFLEGANSIASLHKYEFSDEEKMLMLLKEFEYLLERVSKYYIASSLNIDKVNNFEYMINATLEIEKIIKAMNDYNYPNELKEQRKIMNSMWKTHKEFLYKSEKIFLPNLLHSSIKNFERVIEKIALFHKQNQ